jgi:hypothetical protein
MRILFGGRFQCELLCTRERVVPNSVIYVYMDRTALQSEGTLLCLAICVHPFQLEGTLSIFIVFWKWILSSYCVHLWCHSAFFYSVFHKGNCRWSATNHCVYGLCLQARNVPWICSLLLGSRRKTERCSWFHCRQWGEHQSHRIKF